jgi:acyl-CoA synthetase (AMP-forming)/AMP-acid ligase II
MELPHDEGTMGSYSSILTFSEPLQRRAAQHPDRLACAFLLDGENAEVSYTYHELDRQARAIAAFLQSFNKVGERAMLIYPPGLEFIAAFFGCLYAGIIAVPAYPPRNNRNVLRLEAIVADAQPAVALTMASSLGDLQRWLALNARHAAMRCVATDGCSERGDLRWREPDLRGHSLAFLQHTSGSTGDPKGVKVSHRNLLSNQRIIRKASGHSDRTLMVGWTPLYHDMGLIGNFLQPLYAGGSCVLMAPVAFLQKPIRWLQAVSHYRGTTSGGANFAYEMCVDAITQDQRETLDLSCWEVAYNGAEPIRARTLDRFAAAFEACAFRPEAFYPCYGLAEATLFVTGGPKKDLPSYHQVNAGALGQGKVVDARNEDPIKRVIVGCGRSWLGQKVVIVDPVSLAECQPRRVGEIWIAGPSVAEGFWNRPEETLRCFGAHLSDTGEGPFLRTGDLGYLRDGQLFVTGRLKDLIIVRGRNHYPQDIEASVEQSHASLRPGYGAAFSIEGEDGVGDCGPRSEAECSAESEASRGDRCHSPSRRRGTRIESSCHPTAENSDSSRDIERQDSTRCMSRPFSCWDVGCCGWVATRDKQESRRDAPRGEHHAHEPASPKGQRFRRNHSILAGGPNRPASES